MILLDLRLPKIDGLDVLRQIKETELLKRIPIVVLTTSEAERDVTSAYDAHANSYLVKPVSFESFNSMMRELDYYWIAFNHKPEL